MSNVAIKGGATGTATYTIEAPTGNTDRTLVLPDEAGTVLTSASSISSSKLTVNGFFHATMSADQSISDTTFTKVAFDTESVDSDSWYDTSTYRYTPQVAGWYRFDCKLQFADGSLTRFIGDIAKNATGLGSNRWVDLAVNGSGGVPQFHGSIFFHLNGSSDYVEAYAWIDNTGSDQFLYSADGVYFAGQLVRAD